MFSTRHKIYNLCFDVSVKHHINKKKGKLTISDLILATVTASDRRMGLLVSDRRRLLLWHESSSWLFMTLSNMLSQRAVKVVDLITAPVVALVLRSLLLYNINKDMFKDTAILMNKSWSLPWNLPQCRESLRVASSWTQRRRFCHICRKRRVCRPCECAGVWSGCSPKNIY